MIRILLLFLAITRIAIAAENRVLFLGDSITYDGRWASRVEVALRSSDVYGDAEIINVGLGSETTSGLSEPNHAGGKFPRPCVHERLQRVLDRCKPTLVIACYGMNDGIYLPEEDGRMKAYQVGMTRLKEEVEKIGARIIFVTPPLFNPDKNKPDPSNYDAVLDAQSAWLAGNKAQGWEVIETRSDLRAAVAAAKSKDASFVYAPDSVHPGDEGHRFIAESVVKGLWPILHLEGAPRLGGQASQELMYRRARILRDAYLSDTRHTRPGVPAGLPVVEAEAKAAGLLKEYAIAKTAGLSDWSGYERLDFMVDGRAALVVRPKQPAKGRPWIWRTEFFGHEPQGDIALLGKGYHVAYIDVQNMYGAPVGLAHMDALYDHLTAAYDLSRKVTLEGFSRGGLFAFNWAALHPDRTASLYVDAPVCDFKSWPGGKGKGPGAPADWKRCLDAYDLSEAEALAYTMNPVDKLEPLSKAGIPIIAVIGDADEVVPVSENIDLVEKRYKELGGKIEVIRKPGGKHHPHSLKDPKQIVDFITAGS